MGVPIEVLLLPIVVVVAVPVLLLEVDVESSGAAYVVAVLGSAIRIVLGWQKALSVILKKLIFVLV